MDSVMKMSHSFKKGEGVVGGENASLPIETLLNALPFGLSIRRTNGSVVYANAKSDGEARGDKGQKGFEQRHLDFTLFEQGFVATLGLDETEWHTREQRLIEAAYFDELTKLPNRRFIKENVTTLISSAPENPFALVFIDLDGFKGVNDYFGHHVGDLLLVHVSKRLSGGLQPSDLLARLSGDEFVLVLTRSEVEGGVVAAVNAISEHLKVPYFIENNEIHSSASFGVSLFPQHGKTYEELRTNADRAMYRSKRRGADKVQIFSPELEFVATETSRLEERLRRMVRERRVTCAYQPKIDIRRNEICGVEVLLRFIGGDGEILPPGTFVELAIELDLIDEISFMVLERTLASIDLIDAAFGESGSISINVAARQAVNLKFMRELLSKIAASGLASRFILEITEEAFVEKSFFQEQVLPLIRTVGARVSIDDFGVGYSSLSALAEITADEVKIDRTFISLIDQRPRNQSVLKAIEALAQSLNMNVVVEGIEHQAELDYIKANTNIDCAQGFYYARPILLKTAIDGLREGRLHECSRPGRTGRSIRSRKPGM